MPGVAAGHFFAHLALIALTAISRRLALLNDLARRFAIKTAGLRVVPQLGQRICQINRPDAFVEVVS